MNGPATGLPGATEFFTRSQLAAPARPVAPPPSPERRRAQDALKALLALTASGSGEEFLRTVVRQLSELFGVRYVSVAVLEPGPPERARTLAVWAEGAWRDNFSYDLEHTPCANVLREGLCHYPDSVQALFPQDALLREMGAESYVGLPLATAPGETAGMLALLDTKPLPLPEVHRDMLGVLAARVGNELARLHAEQALRESEERFHQLADLTEDIVWVRELHPAPRLVYLSPAFEQVYGQPRARFLVEAEASDRCIHPEDLGPVQQAFREVTQAGGTRVSTEFRIRRPDGSERWLADNATIVRAADGRPLRVSGVSRDITRRKQAELAVLAERARFRDLFEQSPDAIFVETIQGTVLDVNRAACELHGLPREELVGRHVTDLVPPTQRAAVVREFSRIATGRVRVLQSHSLHRDGTPIPVELRISRILHEGQPALLLHVRDITARMDTERALEGERARFRSLFENSPNAIWEADFSALHAWLISERATLAGLRGDPQMLATALGHVRLLGMNRSALALHTATQSPAAQGTLPGALAGERSETLASLCEALAGGATSFELESYSRRDDDRPLHLLLDFYIPNSAGRPDYGHAIVAGTDITERRLAAARLEGQRRVLELIARGHPLAAILTELVRQIEELCEGLRCCLFVRSRDGTRLQAAAAPSLPPEALAALDNEAVATGRTTAAVAARTGQLVEVPDYETSPVSEACRALARRVQVRAGLAYPVRARDDQVIGVFGCYYATPRPAAPAHLEVLAAAAALFSVAVERHEHDRALAASAIALKEANTALLSLARSEVIARGELAAALREITEAGARGVGVARASVWFFTPDGTELRCRDSYDRTRGRHQAERAVRVAEHPEYFAAIEHERLLVVADALRDTRTGTFVGAYCRPLGIGSLVDAGIRHQGRVVGILCLEHVGPPRAWSPEQVLLAGSLADIVSLGLQADEQQRARAALRRSEERYRSVVDALAEGVMLVEGTGRLTTLNRAAEEILGLPEDEAARWALHDPGWEVLSGEGRPMAPEEYPVSQTLRTGQPHSDVELGVRRPDGQRVWISVNARPLGVGAEGRPASAVVSFTNITERRAAQQALRELNAALEQRVEERTAELAAINRELGEFAYVVTHDLKAPLRGISQLAEWITQDHADRLDPEGQRYFSLIRQRVLHLHELVDGLLACARVGRAPEPESDVPLGELIQEVLGHLSPPANVTIEVPPDLPVVRANAQRLHQVFQNLLDNALKYLDKPQGRVAIQAWRRTGEWEFCVADNGPGIDPRFHERVFKIFQRLTVDANLPGTGLGLTLVKRIVESRGGSIWIESKTGQGTRMHFLWPDRRRRPAGGEPQHREAALMYGEIPDQP
jgi:PAS domain S-box-containing protein